MFRDTEGIDVCVGLASRAWYRVWCVSPKMGSNGSSNPHGISIGLRTVRHETFEVGLGDSMVGHDVVEVMPEKNLSIFVIGLEVAASDDRDALVGSVVYVAGHGGPLGHTFDMIQACSRSSSGCMCLTKTTPLPGPTSNILKLENLSVSSPWPRD
jgi:hypothetical protein